jgi:hypothetical protein
VINNANTNLAGSTEYQETEQPLSDNATRSRDDQLNRYHTLSLPNTGAIAAPISIKIHLQDFTIQWSPLNIMSDCFWDEFRRKLADLLLLPHPLFFAEAQIGIFRGNTTQPRGAPLAIENESEWSDALKNAHDTKIEMKKKCKKADIFAPDLFVKINNLKVHKYFLLLAIFTNHKLFVYSYCRTLHMLQKRLILDSGTSETNSAKNETRKGSPVAC